MKPKDSACNKLPMPITEEEDKSWPIHKPRWNKCGVFKNTTKEGDLSMIHIIALAYNKGKKILIGLFVLNDHPKGTS